jgi:hypothetical protein
MVLMNVSVGGIKATFSLCKPVLLMQLGIPSGRFAAESW